MEGEINLAFAIARALTEGKTTEELARLQILLQTVSSLVAAELAGQRLKGGTENKSK